MRPEKGQRSRVRRLVESAGKFTTLFTTYPRLHTRSGRDQGKALFFLQRRRNFVRDRHSSPSNQGKLLFLPTLLNAPITCHIPIDWRSEISDTGDNSWLYANFICFHRIAIRAASPTKAAHVNTLDLYLTKVKAFMMF